MCLHKGKILLLYQHWKNHSLNGFAKHKAHCNHNTFYITLCLKTAAYANVSTSSFLLKKKYERMARGAGGILNKGIINSKISLNFSVKYACLTDGFSTQLCRSSLGVENACLQKYIYVTCLMFNSLLQEAVHCHVNLSNFCWHSYVISVHVWIKIKLFRHIVLIT